MYSGIRKLTELLYPRRCPICDGILGSREPLVCRKCGKTLHFIETPACLKCGRPLSKCEQEYCSDCGKNLHEFEQGFAPFSYGGSVQSSMMRFKYGGRAEYAGFYAAAMAGFGKKQLQDWKPEILIPVPVHRNRLIKRGYNQAEKLAQSLSRICGIPSEPHAVVRMKNTLPQKELSRIERKRNLEQAFSVAAGYHPPGRILLVDDIYTTGSTIDTLAALLKKNGAQKVWFACACVSPGDS